MSSGPDHIEQSDVHEDAVRAIKVLVAKASMLLLVLLVAGMALLWWRIA